MIKPMPKLLVWRRAAWPSSVDRRPRLPPPPLPPPTEDRRLKRSFLSWTLEIVQNKIRIEVVVLVEQ